MTGYIDAKEIMDAADALDALVEVRDDLAGVAGLLQYATESQSGITDAMLAVLHDVVLAACEALGAIAPAMEAATRA